MTADLRPYPEYKESGLPWLDRVPAHWEIGRNGRLFEQRNQNGFVDLPILEVSLKTGVRVRDMDNMKRKQVMSDREKYKRAAKGDIAYNMMRMWQGAVGVAPVDGLVSPAYVVARPYSATEPRYFAYLFRTKAYMNEVDGYSRGIVKDRNRLYWQDFKRIPSCIPPHEEQKAIADYLDANAMKVRQFIHNRRRLIEALSERTATYARNAVEAEDVTSSRLGLLADQVLRPVYRVPDDEYIPIGLYNRGRGLFHKQVTKGSDLGDSDFYWIEERDLIISGQFAWEGAVALAGEEDSGCIASHRYPVLRGKQGLAESAYLLAFFNTPYGRLLLDCNSRGAAGRNRPLNLRMLMKEKIPTPPLPVQVKIAEILQSEMKLKRIVSKEIAVILEYRNHLITDVVTGKVDVRHFSPDIGDSVDDLLDYKGDMDIGDMMMDEELEGASDIDDSEGN